MRMRNTKELFVPVPLVYARTGSSAHGSCSANTVCSSITRASRRTTYTRNSATPRAQAVRSRKFWGAPFARTFGSLHRPFTLVNAARASLDDEGLDPMPEPMPDPDGGKTRPFAEPERETSSDDSDSTPARNAAAARLGHVSMTRPRALEDYGDDLDIRQMAEEAMDQKLLSAELRNEQLRLQLEAAVRAKRILSDEADLLRAKVRELESAAFSEAERRRGWESQVELLMARISKLEDDSSRVPRLQDEVDRAAVANNQLRTQLEITQRSMYQLQNELDRAANIERDRSVLEERIRELENNLELAQKRQLAAERRVQQLEGAVSVAERGASLLGERTAQQETSLEAVHRHTSFLEKRAETLQEELNEKSSRIRFLENELERLRALVGDESSVEGKRSESEADFDLQLEAVERASAELQEQTERLQEALDGTEDALTSSKETELSLRERVAELEEWEMEAKSLEEKNVHLQMLLAASQEGRGDLDGVLQSLKGMYEGREREFGDRIRELEKGLEIAQDALVSSRLENDRLVSLLQSSGDVVVQLQKQTTSLQQENEETRLKRRRDRKQHEELLAQATAEAEVRARAAQAAAQAAAKAAIEKTRAKKSAAAQRSSRPTTTDLIPLTEHDLDLQDLKLQAPRSPRPAPPVPAPTHPLELNDLKLATPMSPPVSHSSSSSSSDSAAPSPSKKSTRKKNQDLLKQQQAGKRPRGRPPKK